jgi:formate hydrogenlyase subunit 3/multisubunit Na+/H+ antiporter MnhD subunit
MAGNLGALVAQDIPGFYACFALMSFAAYGLIVHALTPEARHAARVYIILVVIGEAALAFAMIMASSAAGAIDFASVRSALAVLPDRDLVIALAFLGFGIKAGVLLLHVWLPLAHPVAPVPASAVLSGTVIVTGLVGWLRFLPIGDLAAPGWGGVLIAVGLVAAFYGAAIGTDQHNPKVVLAYSSISQMGIMTAGVGLALTQPALARPLALAIGFFALHHGLAKSALFLGAGLAATRLTSARRRWLAGGLLVPSLALAGAPLTSGMLAKLGLLGGDGTPPDGWGGLLRFLLPLTSIATALLMARFHVLVLRGPEHPAPHTGAALPWITLGTALALVLFLPWWIIPGDGYAWTAETVLSSAWPLVAALLIASIAVRSWRRAGAPHIPEIPAGDVLMPLERASARVGSVVRAVSSVALGVAAAVRRAAGAWRGRAWALLESSERVETALNRWRLALLLATLLGAIVAISVAG